MQDSTVVPAVAPVVTFLTIQELKTRLNVPKLEVGWSHKGKLIVVDNANAPTFTLKCQQSLDKSKPMAFLVEDNNIEQGCLVNVDRDIKPLQAVEIEL